MENKQGGDKIHKHYTLHKHIKGNGVVEMERSC